ncbi:hypothetical protein OHC33_007445 [Knufia fluminis]|uniref:Uncharacterized protein n=1 Tax=Knufia fluminis TaxID=191047 RepID=A0AAN8EBF1_9EURO|nr:hypothetical protein OHC33_007445 [Knufia fluminis]
MPVDSPRTSSNEGRPDYKPNIGGGKPPTDASGDQTHPIQSLDPQGAPRDYAEKEECSSTEQTQSADAHPSNVAWQQRPLSTSPRALRPTSHAQTAIPDQNFSNHEGQHDLPSAPSDVDRRYIMRSRQWQIVTGADSAEVLVAPVTDDQHNDDIPEVSDDPEDAMTAMAEDVKIDGTFRRIYIRYDNDPEGRLAQTQCIMHDTGAGCSLTFASKLKELGLDYEPLRFRRPLRSLNGDPFYPIGKKQICFSYNGKGDKKHWTDVFVLADPPEEWEPAFDMLFGRDTIKKVKAIGWNHDSPAPFAITVFVPGINSRPIKVKRAVESDNIAAHVLSAPIARQYNIELEPYDGGGRVTEFKIVGRLVKPRWRRDEAEDKNWSTKNEEWLVTDDPLPGNMQALVKPSSSPTNGTSNGGAYPVHGPRPTAQEREDSLRREREAKVKRGQQIEAARQAALKKYNDSKKK